MSTGRFVIDARLRAELRARQVHMWEGQDCQFSAQAIVEPPFAPMVGVTIRQPAEFGAFSYTYSHLRQVASVGRYCSIAERVEFAAVEHPTDRVSTSSFTYDPTYIWKTFTDAERSDFIPIPVPPDGRHGPVRIGHDVWIGANAYIRGGVTIGNGAIVGARAVVTRDVPPYAIVVGNPGRVIRYRVEPDMAAALQSLRWWDYAYTDFGDLPFDKPAQFIDMLQGRIDRGEAQPYRPTPIDLGRLLTQLAPAGVG